MADFQRPRNPDDGDPPDCDRVLHVHFRLSVDASSVSGGPSIRNGLCNFHGNFNIILGYHPGGVVKRGLPFPIFGTTKTRVFYQTRFASVVLDSVL